LAIDSAVTAALLRGRTDTQAPSPLRPDQSPLADLGMIPLTVPEIARLLSETATMRPVTRPDLAGTTSAPGSPATPRTAARHDLIAGAVT